MNKNFKQYFTGIFLALALAFAAAGPALAQEETPEPTPEATPEATPTPEVETGTPSCEGDSVTGTVVATDMDTNTITLYTATGLCTVELGGEHDHNLVDLLGAYFDDVDVDELTGAMEPVGGYATYDETTGTWTHADETTEGALAINVLSVTDNGDGTFTISFLAEGSDAPQQLTTADAELAAAYAAALAENGVTLDIEVGEDGQAVVTGAGDDVAALRDEGLGFGVIVKLMAIARDSGVPLEQLVAEFKSGIGLGQLFAMYGKPDETGVGHTFQDGDNPGNGNGNGGEGGPPEGKGPDKDGDGEKDHGNGGGGGNGNGNGDDDDSP
ncbi:MAG: hypothetical protein EPO32_05610 [Anaerolineae bacterium]|nr:MAG: hypothetical protein EPO32_05610 [Anaerolineae bacterium]